MRQGRDSRYPSTLYTLILQAPSQHDSAVSKASARLGEEMVSDKRLSKLVDQLESNFKG